MNSYSFTGRLGQDAEVRLIPSGASVCSFSVAVESGWGDKKATTWIRCSLWGKQAEGGLPPILTKGKLVGVVGELSAREYEANGVNKTSLEVRVNDVTLLGDGGQSDAPRRQTPEEFEGAGRQGMGAKPKAHDVPVGFEDSGIPF